jgi:threonine/homoserine/homoserine lactone efflux protein
MHPILLLLLAFGLGVIAAIPIGPCQIETAKRAIAGHLRASQMVAAGSVTADVAYGVVALFGIAPVLQVPEVLVVFSGVGALVLWVLSYFTWKESRKPREVDLASSSLGSRRWAYLVGVSVGLTNPPIILSWLFGAALAKRLGLAALSSYGSKLWFIAVAALGIWSYLAALAVSTHRMRHFISRKTVRAIYRWLSVALLLFSLYFVFGVVEYLLRLA